MSLTKWSVEFKDSWEGKFLWGVIIGGFEMGMRGWSDGDVVYAFLLEGRIIYERGYFRGDGVDWRELEDVDDDEAVVVQKVFNTFLGEIVVGIGEFRDAFDRVDAVNVGDDLKGELGWI